VQKIIMLNLVKDQKRLINEIDFSALFIRSAKSAVLSAFESLTDAAAALLSA